MEGTATLQAMQNRIAAEMRERIENETGRTSIRFTFSNISEPRPAHIVTNRWEARAEFYSARMESPQIGYFEVSTIDSAATLQAMKNKVAAKMKQKIENEIGQTNIFFTFRNLSELRPGPQVNDRWEVRADF